MTDYKNNLKETAPSLFDTQTRFLNVVHCIGRYVFSISVEGLYVFYVNKEVLAFSPITN